MASKTSGPGQIALMPKLSASPSSAGVPDIQDRVHTFTPDGKPAKERITSVMAARALFEKQKRFWLPSARRRSRLQGLVDGNPPYNPKDLEDRGLGYMTNVNTLEAGAIIEQKAGAFFELFFEVPTLIEVALRSTVFTNNPGKAEWGQIIAEEFTRTVREWPEFLRHIVKARKESDVGGFGVLVWPDEYDWRPKSFSTGQFFTDSEAEPDVEQFQYFFLRDKMQAGDLYRAAVENPDRSRKQGWDPEEVKKVLLDVYVREAQRVMGAEKFQVSQWEAVQQMIRNNDYWTQTAEFEPVRIVHMLCKEVATGKVSRYIFTDRTIGEPPENEKFLFRSQEVFDRMSQVIWLLPYNFGDAQYLRSVRGLASRIEGHCDLSNRFIGRVFDAGFMTASLLLQPSTPQDVARLQLIRMGAVTVVPAGMSAIQSSFQPQITPLVQLRELSSTIMRNNTGVFKQMPEAMAENQIQKTAQQVVYEQGKEARLEKVGVAFDYVYMEILYKEMFRRLTNTKYLKSSAALPGKEEALTFVRRCVARGVPPEILTAKAEDALEITVAKAIGMGSWGVKMDLTNQMLGVRALLPPEGARNAIRDYVGARVGWQKVDRYAGELQPVTVPTNDVSVAQMENNDFANGQAVQAGADQKLEIHIPTHAQPIMQVVQQFAQTRGQGMDVQKALAMMEQALPHLEQHIQFLAQDPAQKAAVQNLVASVLKPGAATYKALAKIVVDQNKMRAMDRQRNVRAAQAQQQQALDAQSAAVMAESQRKLQLEMAKQESLNEMRRVKTEQQMAIRRAQAQADLKLKAERQIAEIDMDSRKVDADVALKQARANG